MPLYWLPRGSDGKESVYDAGDLRSISGLGRSPGEGKGYHSSIMTWDGLCSPWGRKESDMSERLSLLGVLSIDEIPWE